MHKQASAGKLTAPQRGQRRHLGPSAPAPQPRQGLLSTDTAHSLRQPALPGPTNQVVAFAGRRLGVHVTQPRRAVRPHPRRLDGPAGPGVPHSQALRSKRGQWRGGHPKVGPTGLAACTTCRHSRNKRAAAVCWRRPLVTPPPAPALLISWAAPAGLPSSVFCSAVGPPLACSRSASSTRSMPDAPSASSSSMRSFEVVNVGTTSSPAGLLHPAVAEAGAARLGMQSACPGCQVSQAGSLASCEHLAACVRQRERMSADTAVRLCLRGSHSSLPCQQGTRSRCLPPLTWHCPCPAHRTRACGAACCAARWRGTGSSGAPRQTAARSRRCSAGRPAGRAGAGGPCGAGQVAGLDRQAHQLRCSASGASHARSAGWRQPAPCRLLQHCL